MGLVHPRIQPLHHVKPSNVVGSENKIDGNYDSPRHSTTLRDAPKSGTMSHSGSVSDLLSGLLKKRPTDKANRTSYQAKPSKPTGLTKHTSMMKHSGSGAKDEEEARDMLSNLNLEKSKAASHDVLNMPLKSEGSSSGLSRLLSFGKKKLGGDASGSSPALDKKPKRDREITNTPTGLGSSPSKVSPASNSAYDIREPLNVQRQLTLDDYYLIRRVGKGGFATVFLVRLKGATGRYFALKAMKKSEVVRLRQERQIMNEKNILLELKHWLLVELYHTFQTPSHLFMVMEFVCGGDLFTLLRRSKFFPENQAKFYVAQVTLVLEYLHSKSVVYRDLKPEVDLFNVEYFVGQYW